MTSKNIKILVLGSAIVLLAAACNNSQTQASSQNSSSTEVSANASSTMANMPGMHGYGMASSTSGHFGMQNLPPGSKPFFGTIASVSGSQITVSGRSRTSSGTVSTIIDITSSTQFTGGSQTSLTGGTRIAGVGTANSDGSINATTLQINPTFSGRGSGGRYQGGGPSQSQNSQ